MFAKIYATLSKITDEGISKIWVSESPYKNNLTLVQNSILAIEQKLKNCNSLDNYMDCLLMSDSDKRLECYCGEFTMDDNKIVCTDNDNNHYFKFEVI